MPTQNTPSTGPKRETTTLEKPTLRKEACILKIDRMVNQTRADASPKVRAVINSKIQGGRMALKLVTNPEMMC